MVNAFFGVGSSVGPILGVYLFEVFGSWRVPFMAYGVAGLLCALCVALLVPARFTQAHDEEVISAADIGVAEGELPLINRNSAICLTTAGLLGFAFFSYVSLYPTYLKTELGFSIASAATAFGMFGVGALSAVFMGWVGEKIGKTGVLGGLSLLAVTGYAMFNGVASFSAQASLSLAFGILVSGGYLYPRLITVAQRCVSADHISYLMSLLVVFFYLPGLAAGAVFGTLAHTAGWGTAGNLCVVLPAVAGALMFLFLRRDQIRGTAPHTAGEPDAPPVENRASAQRPSLVS